jgi:polar amino acid transport system substrate-binding protein
MTRRLLVLLAALTLVVTACGGDDDDDPTTTAVDAAGDTTTTTADDTTTTAGDPTTTAGDTSTTVGEDPTATGPPEECAVEGLPLKTPGTLTVATGEPAFPPWIGGDDDPTAKEGFESTVVYAISGRMGLADQVTWVRTGFDEAIAPGPKDYDFNIQQFSISEERDEVVDFSEPYYTVQQSLVAYSDSGITAAETAADLAGYRLGAQIGTTSLDYIENVIQPTTPASVYDTNADVKAALDAGQIDGVVFDLPTAYNVTAVEIPEATIVGVLEAPGAEPEELGLLFEDGSPLVECVNVAIRSLKEDGTFAALEEIWLAQEGEVKTIRP